MKRTTAAITKQHKAQAVQLFSLKLKMPWTQRIPAAQILEAPAHTGLFVCAVSSQMLGRTPWVGGSTPWKRVLCPWLFKKSSEGAGEVAQRLSTDQNLVPRSTTGRAIAVCNFSTKKTSVPSSGLSRTLPWPAPPTHMHSHTCTLHTHIHTHEHAHTHK